MLKIVKRLAARLPQQWQTELKRIRFKRQIKKNVFLTHEPEYRRLDEWIRPGDWVIDVGANVGHYTKRFSELAGPQGRVIAFEPVPTTFSLLASNTQLFAHSNVSLVNAAVSDKLDIVGMSIPAFATKLDNFYEAHISPASGAELSVLVVSIDSLGIDRPVALVKIDAEGHEVFVLAGMRELINRWHPVLVVETGSREVIVGLEALGYVAEKLPDSPNVVFRPRTGLTRASSMAGKASLSGSGY